MDPATYELTTAEIIRAAAILISGGFLVGLFAGHALGCWATRREKPEPPPQEKECWDASFDDPDKILRPDTGSPL